MRPLLVGDLCADLILPYGEVLKSLKTIKDGNFKKNDVIFKHGGTIGNTSSIMARLNDHPLFVTDLCADSIGIDGCRGRLQHDFLTPDNAFPQYLRNRHPEGHGNDRQADISGIPENILLCNAQGNACRQYSRISVLHCPERDPFHQA